MSRSLSKVYLVAEIKGIYAGLVTVEVKCIEVEIKSNACKYRLYNTAEAERQALIAFHGLWFSRALVAEIGDRGQRRNYVEHMSSGDFGW